MKRFLPYLSIGLISLILAGCSTTFSLSSTPSEDWCEDRLLTKQECGIKEGQTGTDYKDHINTITSFGKGSAFKHRVYNSSTNGTLAYAATQGLTKGFEYFSILAPAKISNKSGSDIDTAEEFINQCNINAGHVLLFLTNPCGIHMTETSSRISNIVVQYFNEKPQDMNAYNAKDVITYMIKEDIYDLDDKLVIGAYVKSGDKKKYTTRWLEFDEFAKVYKKFPLSEKDFIEFALKEEK